MNDHRRSDRDGHDHGETALRRSSPGETANETANDRRRLGLAELTRQAGVSVRTVRYYIAEGLLPPPVGAGPRSAYTDAHLDRLRLIARFKAAYLPLKEIRRRLAGLDDAGVRRLLADAGDESTGPPPGADGAAAYLDRVLGARRRAGPALPSPRTTDDDQLPIWAGPETTPLGLAEDDPAGLLPFAPVAAAPPSPSEPGPPAPLLGRAYPASFGPPSADDVETTEAVDAADAWRRVSLGDDAELLIRESAFRRRRDRVEWLIGWARKVFG